MEWNQAWLDAEDSSRASTWYEREFMKSKVISLVLYCALLTNVAMPVAASTGCPASATNATLTGKISCSKCQGIQPTHKGYTRWTLALHSVGEGDQIVFVVGNDTYQLQGDKDQLLKHMEDKVTVSGDLVGRTFVVRTIAPASKVR